MEGGGPGSQVWLCLGQAGGAWVSADPPQRCLRPCVWAHTSLRAMDPTQKDALTCILHTIQALHRSSQTGLRGQHVETDVAVVVVAPSTYLGSLESSLILAFVHDSPLKRAGLVCPSSHGAGEKVKAPRREVNCQNSPPDPTASFPTAPSPAAVSFLCHSPLSPPALPPHFISSYQSGGGGGCSSEEEGKPIDKADEGGRCRMCNLDQVGHTLVSGASSLPSGCGPARPKAGVGWVRGRLCGKPGPAVSNV